MKNGKHCAAIVLAAGKGTRMGSGVAKQYLPLGDQPVLCYSLRAFEDSFIDEIVIVAAKDEISYCKQEIVERFGFKKVSAVTEGGAERYHSVAYGLRAIRDCDVVFIHDGARPFIDEAMLTRLFDAVSTHGTAIAGMPVKDTVKIADADGFAASTPDRNLVWQMQTPQTFAYRPILEAYEKLLAEETSESAGVPAACGSGHALHITDDAMVMETFGSLKVKLVEGSYKNIKITTPEDMKIAQALL